MKLTINKNYISNFSNESENFEIKTELAYIIGKDRLDNDLMQFVDSNTYYDGIYIFSIFIKFLYEEYKKYQYYDIYEFIHKEYQNCFEKFQKICFKKEI